MYNKIYSIFYFRLLVFRFFPPTFIGCDETLVLGPVVLKIFGNIEVDETDDLLSACAPLLSNTVTKARAIVVAPINTYPMIGIYDSFIYSLKISILLVDIFMVHAIIDSNNHFIWNHFICAYPITAHAIRFPECPVVKLSEKFPNPQSSSSA